MKLLYFGENERTAAVLATLLKPQVNELTQAKTFIQYQKLRILEAYDVVLADTQMCETYPELAAATHEREGGALFLLYSEHAKAETLFNYWEAFNGISCLEDEHLARVLRKRIRNFANALGFENPEAFFVAKAGETEKKLFDILLEKANQEFSSLELAKHLYGSASDAHCNSLYSAVHNLRKALGDDLKNPTIIKRVSKGCYMLDSHELRKKESDKE